MGRRLVFGLLGGGLATLLFCCPLTVVLAQTQPATPAINQPSPPAAAKPTAKATDKPAAKVAGKQAAPAHPTKTAATPKPAGKKTVVAKDKRAAKLAAKKLAPAKQAATAPATPSYTVTTTRDHVTTTRVVTVPPPGTLGAKTAAAPAPAQIASSPDPTKPAPTAATQTAAVTQPAATHPDRAPPPTAQATVTTPAASFVSGFLGQAFGIARDANMTPLQRRALLAELFANKMDVGRIAGFTTDEKLTAQSTDFQRRFKTILISYLVETYYPRIELAADPTVKVEVTGAGALPDGTAVVWTTFTKSDWVSQSVKWQLVPEDGGFKIADIFSSGASLVQMERDTFISVMRDGGLPQLMAKLDARTKALASAAP